MRPNLTLRVRILRIVVGLFLLALVSLALVGPQSPLAWLGLVGLVPLVVGLTGC
ncbi:MAG: DUF2892 domain-containing protein [Desulforudis sp.]|jgi:hypothetical protein|nr:MAG: DUF2892 domain-containing protein [Desulforudis sp.]